MTWWWSYQSSSAPPRPPFIVLPPSSPSSFLSLSSLLTSDKLLYLPPAPPTHTLPLSSSSSLTQFIYSLKGGIRLWPSMTSAVMRPVGVCACAHAHVFALSLRVCTHSCLPLHVCVWMCEACLLMLAGMSSPVYLHCVWLCVMAPGRGDEQKSNPCPLKERGAVNLSNYKYIIQDKSLLRPILSSHYHPSSFHSLFLCPNLYCFSLSLFFLCFTTAAASGKLETEYSCLGLLQRGGEGW